MQVCISLELSVFEILSCVIFWRVGANGPGSFQADIQQ